MKVEVAGNSVRIKGKNFPDRHIKIYVSENPGCDRYSISIIDSGIECAGDFPEVGVTELGLYVRGSRTLK